MFFSMKYALMLVVLTLSSCVRVPPGLEPVGGFSLQNYLGTWYEIARMDHSFERGLSKVTATYNLREDGGIGVINKGYLEKEQKWKQAEGRAYFVREPEIGFLRVTFFWPFYGSYIVFELDAESYQYALVSGPSRSYMWILARTPQLPAETLTRLIEVAQSKGFDTSKLIFPES